MAEIRVEEKKGGLAWLWILLLLLLVAAGVWWWMSTQQNTTSPAPGAQGTTAPAAAPARVDSVSLRAPPHTSGMLLLRA